MDTILAIIGCVSLLGSGLCLGFVLGVRTGRELGFKDGTKHCFQHIPGMLDYMNKG